MPAFIRLSRHALYGIAVMLLFTQCRKNVYNELVAPNDIVEQNAPALLNVSLRVNDSFGGYCIGLPEHYTQTTKTYPTIIFLHGLGQTGDGGADLQYITNDGIGKVLLEKKMPGSFFVNGKYYSFIVVSPQFSRPPSVEEVSGFIDYVEQTYRVNKQQLYLSGLSLGARITTLVAAAMPERFAAVVPISGVAPNQGFDQRCESIASRSLPVWGLHNADDPLSDVNVFRRFITEINDFDPGVPARSTIFDVYGHDAWTKALDPAYKENDQNIYEWMLQYSR